MAERYLRIRYLVPLAVLMLFLFGGWTLRNKLAADRQGEWVRATRGDLVTGVEVTGTLAALESDTFGPPNVADVWDFKIAMMAPEGTEVKQGRPVLMFDTSDLQRRLDEKSAESDEALKQIEKKRADLALRTKDERLKLAEAEARLRKAELKLQSPPDIVGITERKQAELDFKLSKQEVEAGRSRIGALSRAAEAEIRLLESKQKTAAGIVAQTQAAIAAMTIVAPRDGTIVYMMNWRGEKKKVGDSTWKQERVLEIPNLNKMKANGEVDEVDAGRVAAGQRVELRLDAHPDEKFSGTIVSAGRTVQQKQQTRDPVKVLRVEIKLDRTDPTKMRPGMRFQGTIELGRVKNALLIPREAVLVDDRGPYTFRRGRFSVEQVHLKLGREGDEKVEVLSGLAPSDRVLVPKVDEKEQEKSS
ncbi:MAG TPA: HlyD family efflux transporter periplasmic adaptor subunit [Thermoanaerobaculia bacterium]